MTKQEHSVPKKMLAKYEAIVGMTDAVCRGHLNEEYAELCRELAAKLSRKRPSPLERGQVKSWAGAIVYTIGRVNFLFDKSQEPHMGAKELCKRMGVSQGTASAKSTQIMDLLGMMQFDPAWTLPSLVGENLLAWMVSVDGFIMDVRHASREVQEEAYRMGLIPYLPE